MNLFRNPIIFKSPEMESGCRRIAYIGACAAAGTSFACLKAAASDSNAVLAEMGNSYFYEALDMRRRFAGRKFVFYEELNSPADVAQIRNNEFGINWLLRRPSFEPAERSSLFRLMSADFRGNVYCDLSGLAGGVALELLAMADELRLVIDPMPGRLIPSAAFIEKLRLLYPNTKLIVNKMNRGVHRGELKRFLGTAGFEEIPSYPIEKLYAAEYECTIPEFV